jgi:hypothetical protein
MPPISDPVWVYLFDDVDYKHDNLPITVAVLFQCAMEEEFQFSWEVVIVALCTKVESTERLLAGWWCDSALKTGVGGQAVHSVPEGAIWSVYVDVQERNVVIGELDVVQVFGFMRPDHECVIHVTEPFRGLVGRPADCHLLKVFHEEVRDRCQVSRSQFRPSVRRTGR